MKKLAIATIIFTTAGSVFAATSTQTPIPQQNAINQQTVMNNSYNNDDYKHEGHGRKHQNHGGFINPNQTVTTVKQLSNMKDGQKVLLQGHIIKNIKKSYFEFKDATGTTTIKISKKAWNGQLITPAQKVSLYGKIDKELFSSLKVKIYHVVVVPASMQK